jgi:hypothetical protein
LTANPLDFPEPIIISFRLLCNKYPKSLKKKRTLFHGVNFYNLFINVNELSIFMKRSAQLAAGGENVAATAYADHGCIVFFDQ